jgi:hypothetical protein
VFAREYDSPFRPPGGEEQVERRQVVRRILVYAVAALLLGAGVSHAQGGKAAPKDGEVCAGDFGTSVAFLKTPSEAAKQALKEEKLVFVLHVSGDFEDPDFT